MNYFVLLLIIFSIVEIILLIKVGGAIGVFNTVLLILGTGIVGAAMARLQGLIILQRISESLNRGVMPSEEILDGALVLVGGICLLDPGVIGDVVGCVLLVPWTRFLVRRIVGLFLKRKIKDTNGIITVNAVRSYTDRDELSG